VILVAVIAAVYWLVMAEGCNDRKALEAARARLAQNP
jgi:hypothetical protein